MDENKMGWREYARYAEMSVEELARDCEVQVFRATGPGGQGVNTTDSAVRMKHGPTGIVVTARESRNQFQNRSAGSTTNTSMRLKRPTVASWAGRNDLINKLR